MSVARFAALRALSSASLLALGSLLPGTALAQQAPLPQVSHPVVQTVPQQSAGMKLNDALNRLAKDPQDADALIDAGKASLDLGDAGAAIGFFQRALSLQPGNARVKAGLAGAYVLSEDPFSAIELFDEAEKAGPIEPDRLSDRGLAFDLVGDNSTAQFYYRQSLAAAPSDETLRRLALSQAIAGDRKGMDFTLSPLLQRQDKAAWRTRAFGLAILGEADEAEAIARQTMPTDMATAITAYLRYMPRLTAAQQASAGNLGHFPRASEIGHDDPRLAQYSRSRVPVVAASQPPQIAMADRGKGREDKSRKGKSAVASQAPAPAPVPPPEVQVSREVTTPGVKLAVAEPAPKPVPAPPPPPPPPPPPKPVPVPAPAPVPVPAPSPNPAASPPQAGPGFATLGPGSAKVVAGFDLGKSPAQPPIPTPAPAPAPAPAPPQPRPRAPSVSDAFADFSAPSREIEPQAGAVDVRRIRPTVEPAKDQATKGKDKDKDAKPAVPSHPSRIWVQLATGRDKAALGFDWRKMAKDDPVVFKGQKPSVTAWGQANRLLAGPFASAKEANAFLAQLKKAGVSGAFVWSSPAGQVVDALAMGK